MTQRDIGSRDVDQHFKELLEASSLGTPDARRVREQTGDHVVDSVRRRLMIHTSGRRPRSRFRFLGEIVTVTAAASAAAAYLAVVPSGPRLPPPAHDSAYRQAGQIATPETASLLAYDSTGNQLATVGYDGSLQVWDPYTQALYAAYRDINGLAHVDSMAFSPNGDFLAVGDSGSAQVWNVADPSTPELLLSADSGGAVVAVTYSPDGKQLATAEDDAVTLWDTVTGTRTASYTAPDGSSISKISFSPDGSTIAASSGSGHVYLWNVPTGRLYATLTGSSTAFSPDGNYLASTEGASIALWDTVTGTRTASYTAISGTALSSVAFSPDGSTIAASSGSGHVYLWNVPTGRLIVTFSGSSMAFSPDGNQLAISDGGTVTLWDPAREEPSL